MQRMLESPHEDFYLMVFILKSWKKGTETNIFIIQCARFAKRSLLILTNSVSILIRLTGRKILVHNKITILDVSNSETEKSGKCDCRERKIEPICPVLMRTNEQKSFLYGDMIFVLF